MAERIARYCEENLHLQNAELSSEYYYYSLPFCVIDAVYSLSANYTSTRNTVIRFCTSARVERLRDKDLPYPAITQQYSIQQFCQLLDSYPSYLTIASELFQNRQRTSTRNGILKAEAVHRFAQVLLAHGVNVFQDLTLIIQNDAFTADIYAIPGQTYGTSLKYFFMLAGEDNLIKPDRMVVRFLQRIVGNQANAQNAQNFLVEALQILRTTYPALTLRELDHEIWKYERSMTDS